MSRLPSLAVLVVLAAGLPAAADKSTLVRLGDVPIRGEVKGENDVSGAAAVGDFLVLGSDEAPAASILKRTADGYTVVGELLLAGEKHDTDIEGVAADGNTVYVTGSHNRIRNIGKKGGGGVTPVPDGPAKDRDRVYRFTLGPDGKPGPVAATSLRPALDAHPILKQFVPVASKENGIDVEGLAAKAGRLYFGFRGPVLRDNWVPVLSCTFDDPAGTAKVAYVWLAGRGIRDVAAVRDGFLILAGPMNDGDGSYRLYFWDGADGLDTDAKPELIGDFPDLGRGKPEGLAVLKEEGKSYELLVVCDGPAKGAPTRWAATRK